MARIKWREDKWFIHNIIRIHRPSSLPSSSRPSSPLLRVHLKYEKTRNRIVLEMEKGREFERRGGIIIRRSRLTHSSMEFLFSDENIHTIYKKYFFARRNLSLSFIKYEYRAASGTFEFHPFDVKRRALASARYGHVSIFCVFEVNKRFNVKSLRIRSKWLGKI